MSPSETLGVSQDATPQEIKSAYRKLAMKHHPDKGGSPDEFQKIQEAYDALTKPKPQSNPFGDGHPFGGFDSSWWNVQQPRANANISVQAHITLEQAHSGSELSATINDRIVTFTVPRGVQHGQRMVIRGEGHREYADLPPGDLVIIVLLRRHHVFEYGGDDLMIVKDIDILDMLTGCDITIETLTGERLTVTVPVGSTPSTRLRIPGRGMPIQNTEQFGSLFVGLNPIFSDLTENQLNGLREIKNA